MIFIRCYYFTTERALFCVNKISVIIIKVFYLRLFENKPYYYYYLVSTFVIVIGQINFFTLKISLYISFCVNQCLV